MKAIKLESDRLFFEPLGLKHLSSKYVSWMNDEEVNRYLESGGNYTLDLLEIFLSEQEKKDILFWAIHLKSNQKHIGNIKIDPIDLLNNSGEYGILIGDKVEWNKGYAKEASLEVIEYCFNVLKLSKITLGVIEGNTDAVKLYEKIGFSIASISKVCGIYGGVKGNAIRMIKENENA
jgi:RimJ/RimL family protein N-acetyltransferase